MLIALAVAASGCAPAMRTVEVVPGTPLVTRAQWGALPAAGEMRPHEIHSITIHHTAGRRNTEKELAQKMRDLQAFSQCACTLGDGRIKAPWADIPYHFYVDHEGAVAAARDPRFAGDTNTAYDPAGHLLIVLEGNFEEEEPTPAQIVTLRRLVYGFRARYGVPPERIDGHRDHAPTLCPGKHLYELIPELRGGEVGGFGLQHSAFSIRRRPAPPPLNPES
jgi:hypothetical protein